MRNAGGYFSHMQLNHEAGLTPSSFTLGGNTYGIKHMVDFKCSNMVDGSLTMKQKQAVCSLPINNATANFVGPELEKLKYKIPKDPLGPVISLIGSYFSPGVEIQLIQNLPWAQTGLAALNASACPSGVCTSRTTNTAATVGQLPPFMQQTPLVEVCPQSCAGCGQIGDMISISIRSLAFVDSTTGSALGQAQETTAASFEQTSSTVDSGYGRVQDGADSVAGGVKGTCNTLSTLAPLIDVAGGVGGAVGGAVDFISGFRRLSVPRGSADGSMFDQLRTTRAELMQAAADNAESLVQHPAFMLLLAAGDQSPLGHSGEVNGRGGKHRRLGAGSDAVDDCREVQGDAEALQGTVADSRSEALTAINNAQSDVTNAINHADNQIRDSIRQGRNQMIGAFETTRTSCNAIRDALGPIRNSTRAVFAGMARGCLEINKIMTDPPGNADGAYAAVEDMMVRLQTPVEMTIGLTHAFIGFKIMIPAAVAIAPGEYVCADGPSSA